MHEWDDTGLLREYVERDSEEAFATLVTRHVNKVYSVALRHTGNPHQAEEITQAVFVILARKSHRLSKRVILYSWLYKTARLVSLAFIRGEIRRARREQEACMQTILNEKESDAWTQIAPLLDAALAGLSETDRRAIVLRFFYGKSMRETGADLGANEDAAKKRVTRALEKLRKYFTNRGVSSTTEIIAGAISANSVQPAPAALANSVTAIALAKGATASISTLTLIKGALKIMAWTKAKITIAISVAVILAAGAVTTLIVQHTSQKSQNQETPIVAGNVSGGGGAAAASPQTSGGATIGNPFVNSLGMKFVPVPGTQVLFGIWDTRVQDYRAYAEANPGVNEWWKTPGILERREFKQGEDHPVVNVSWDDANAFCAWLTQKERKEGKIGQDQEYRLPTDKEWSAAVGPDKYPWGNDWPPPKGAGNYADETFTKENPQSAGIEGYDDGYAFTSPVGSFKANQYGLYDMGGNVYQWCEDWYKSEMNEQGLLDEIPWLKDDGGGGKYRVIRGSNWGHGGSNGLMSSYHAPLSPNSRNGGYGFRCVLASGLQTGAATASPQTGGNDTSTPEEILKQSQDAYAALSSYSDDGTDVVKGPAGIEASSRTFHIRMQRPGFYRIDWAIPGMPSYVGTIWSDGSGDYVEWVTPDGKHKFTKDQAMALEAAWQEAEAGDIPRLFFGVNAGHRDVVLKRIASEGTELKKEKDERIGDVDCYVISNVISGSKVPAVDKLWIGKQDHLIHQYQYSVDADTGKSTLTETHVNISVNGKFSPSDFTH